MGVPSRDNVPAPIGCAVVMNKTENEQCRPIKAWRIGACRRCGGETWAAPIVRKASGFGYLPTGKVEKRCNGCGDAAIGLAAG